MTRPWQGEIDVTEDVVRKLLHSQFPAMDTTQVRLLGKGWDNTAFLIDDALVFRFPRKSSAVPSIETEAKVLPALHARLPIQIPRPEWHGQPSAEYPWPFLGHRLVRGRSACAVRLSRSARERIAPALGEFLQCLHNVPTGTLSLPPDVLDRRNFAGRLPLIVERLEFLCAGGIIDSPIPWLGLFAELEQTPATGADVVVHGDLYARHLLFDEADRLCGVIDWGDVHAGDAAMDLMLLYGFLPAAARPAFLDAYGAAPDPTVLRVARLRAAFHAVSVTWYGLELCDDDLLHEGRQALQFVLED